MTSTSIRFHLLSVFTALTLAATSPSVMAQAKTDSATPAKAAASEPSAYDKTKAAAKKAGKATAKAGGEVVDGTKKVAGKAGSALTSLGEKIDSKVPRTEAYKKQQAKDKAKTGQSTN